MSIIRSLIAISLFILFTSLILTLFTYIFSILLLVLSGLAIFYMISIALSYMSFEKSGKEQVSESKTETTDDRIEILKQKYLRGEISEEKFERLLDLEFNSEYNKNTNLSREYTK